MVLGEKANPLRLGHLVLIIFIFCPFPMPMAARQVATIAERNATRSLEAYSGKVRRSPSKVRFWPYMIKSMVPGDGFTATSDALEPSIAYTYVIYDVRFFRNSILA